MKKLLFTIIIFMFVTGFTLAQDMITAEITNDPKSGQQLVWHPENHTFKWEFVKEDKEDKTEYEVTIHVVYNSIPASEIADLIESQLRKHKDACKVEIKIKNPDSALSVSSGFTGNAYINLTDGNATYYGDTASD